MFIKKLWWLLKSALVKLIAIMIQIKRREFISIAHRLQIKMGLSVMSMFFRDKTFRVWIFRTINLLCSLHLFCFILLWSLISYMIRSYLSLSEINDNSLFRSRFVTKNSPRSKRSAASLRAATVDFLRSIHASRANACRVRICMRTHTYATAGGARVREGE